MISVCKSDCDHDKVDYTERNYKNLVELLEEENALDEETIRNLKEFNQLRNSMSHNF